MSNRIIFPIGYYPDPTKGRPLAGGFLYVGDIDTDPEVVINQKQVTALQENGSEVPIAQPIDLSVGGVPLYNESPVSIFTDGDCSMKVTDKFGAQIYYIPRVAIVSVESVTGTGVDNTDPANPVITINKTTLGLDNVDNTSDADKPISDDTQAALDDKEDYLDLPVSAGYVLTSTTLGARFWTPGNNHVHTSLYRPLTVTFKGQASVTGAWVIAGLTPNVPLYLIAGNEALTSGVRFQFYVNSGTFNDGKTNGEFFWVSSAGTGATGPPGTILIPDETTVSIQITLVSGTGDIRAYQ